MSVFMCAKAESCLCNICVYVVYELNMWIKRCYYFVCDYAACKSIWKCEKSINLLHHICLYTYVQKLSCVFAICICMLYMNCSMYAKTLLFFCVYASFNALMTVLLFFIFYFLFFLSSLSACSLWLWHCLDAVHMLDYMYLDQSRCFISFHWSITSIVCANKRFQSNNFSLSCSHFLVSLYSFHFTLLFSAMTNCMKQQQQKRKSVSEAHSESEFELLLYAKPVSFFWICQESHQNFQKVQNKNQICRINLTALSVLHM